MTAPSDPPPSDPPPSDPPPSDPPPSDPPPSDPPPSDPPPSDPPASDPPASPPPPGAPPPSPRPDPGSGDVGDPGGSEDWQRLVERLTSVATVLAPTTVLTALLLYYGYVATSARLAYFGIDLSTLDLSTQELVLRSTEVVYLPCIVLLGVGLVVQLARTGLRLAISRPGWRRRLQVIGALTLVLAVGLLIRGVVGIADPRVAETESIGFTPGAIGLGVALLTTGGYVLLNVAGPPSPGPQRRVGVPVVLLTWGIVAASLFWIMNSFAFAYGQSRAEYDAQTIDQRPRVIVDTKENPYLYSPCVQTKPLAEAPEQDFRFRLFGLRLLVKGGDRLFLIATSYDAVAGGVRPTPRCPVVVMTQDDSVRLQLLPGAVPAPAPHPDNAG